MKRIGVCLAGCGGYANAHARAFGTVPGVELFFSSRSRARARAFASKYDGTAAGGFDAALGDPRIHALVLTSPHDLHLPQGAAAARAGKALLVEKPLARSVSEGRALAAAARRFRVPLMLGENFSFLPYKGAFRKAVDAGLIGRPLRAAVVDRWSPKIGGWRLSKDRMGGGILIDLGVHYIRFLTELFGGVRRVRSLASGRPRKAMQGESEISIELEFPRNLIGRIDLGWGGPREGRVIGIGVSGTRGGLSALPFEPRYTLRRGERSRTVEIPASDPRGQRALAQAFSSVVRAWLASGRRRTRSVPGPAEGLNDLAVVAAAYASRSAGGRWKGVSA